MDVNETVAMLLKTAALLEGLERAAPGLGQKVTRCVMAAMTLGSKLPKPPDPDTNPTLTLVRWVQCLVRAAGQAGITLTEMDAILQQAISNLEE